MEKKMCFSIGIIPMWFIFLGNGANATSLLNVNLMPGPYRGGVWHEQIYAYQGVAVDNFSKKLSVGAADSSGYAGRSTDGSPMSVSLSSASVSAGQLSPGDWYGHSLPAQVGLITNENSPYSSANIHYTSETQFRFFDEGSGAAYIPFSGDFAFAANLSTSSLQTGAIINIRGEYFVDGEDNIRGTSEFWATCQWMNNSLTIIDASNGFNFDAGVSSNGDYFLNGYTNIDYLAYPLDFDTPYNFHYNLNISTRLNEAQPIPEPSTLLLFSLGFACFGWIKLNK